MALEREALTHKIEDDLALRNRNWNQLDSHLAEAANKHIAESGSNSDGYYIKFDDGTMMCWGTVPGVTPTFEKHGTGVWRSPVLYYDYPQPFYGINPSVSVSVGSPGNYGIWHESASSSLNQWSYRMFAMDDQSGYGVGIARFLAVGRWK